MSRSAQSRRVGHTAWVCVLDRLHDGQRFLAALVPTLGVDLAGRTALRDLALRRDLEIKKRSNELVATFDGRPIGRDEVGVIDEGERPAITSPSSVNCPVRRSGVNGAYCVRPDRASSAIDPRRPALGWQPSGGQGKNGPW